MRTWSLKTERVIRVWGALHQVLLGQLGVAEVVVGREEKVKSEALKLKQVSNVKHSFFVINQFLNISKKSQSLCYAWSHTASSCSIYILANH